MCFRRVSSHLETGFLGNPGLVCALRSRYIPLLLNPISREAAHHIARRNHGAGRVVRRSHHWNAVQIPRSSRHRGRHQAVRGRVRSAADASRPRSRQADPVQGSRCLGMAHRRDCHEPRDPDPSVRPASADRCRRRRAALDHPGAARRPPASGRGGHEPDAVEVEAPGHRIGEMDDVQPERRGGLHLHPDRDRAAAGVGQGRRPTHPPKPLRVTSRGGHLGPGNTLEADMKRSLFAAGLLAGALSAVALTARPVQAQQAKVGDWTIEKRTQDAHCNESRGCKDKEDENRDYVIVITYSEKAIVIVMIYDGWEWDKVGEILRADVGTDDADIMKKAKWEVMDKTAVRGIFEYDQSMMDRLSKAKRLSLDFEDDDDDSIEMQVPRAGEALAALKFCEENRK